MKKIKEGKPVFPLIVELIDGIDLSESKGKIIQVDLLTRDMSVPLIVPGSNSIAKKHGTDGIFALCSEECADHLEDTISREVSIFKGVKDNTLH
ncbi:MULTISPECIES: hypothetical protein [unclassified Bacillus (in: firmicutes)]|uniref:hypothetical protein n=1 Tax=unclassified Bacillus (in: firmicutes) TaxID=185979 RepID=UPI001114601D|nr:MULTISPECIES: hypothetical protein [unclassified Bacillus (in: firmicutes)]